MKPAPISEAKRLGLMGGATRVAVLMLDDNGSYSVTTWGKTKRQCGKLKEWSDRHSDAILMEMFEEAG